MNPKPGKTPIKEKHQENNNSKTSFLWCLCILLCLTVFTSWVFSTEKNHGFVWDDVDYVQNNPMLGAPFSKALTHFFSRNYYVGNYHPITMMGYHLIFQKAGLNPKAYHLVVKSIHILNIILVFWFIYLISDRKLWIASWIAALFAVHPLHVESVVWISGLKDVLFFFFFILGSITYQYQWKKEKIKLWYALTLFFFILSALSKPAALSFPFVLLLLDYWKRGTIKKTDLLSKIPFFLLALLFGLLTLQAQNKAMEVAVDFNLVEKLMLASYAILFYVFKLFVPIDLSALHPLPSKIDFPLYYKIASFLLIFSAYLVWAYRKNKILLFGLGFFIVNVVLVLQIVTVGSAVVAERYTYLPYLGLFLIIAFYLDRFFIYNNYFAKYKTVLIGCSFAPIAVLGLISHKRVEVWQNNKTLWTNVLRQYPNCSTALYNLGAYYFKEIRDDDLALPYFRKSIEKNPKDIYALINLGVIYGRKNEFELAFEYFRSANDIDPEFIDLLKNRGYVYGLAGNVELAIQDISSYLNKVPKDAMIYAYRSSLYKSKNSNELALHDISMALRLEASNSSYLIKRAELYFLLSRIEEARSDIQKAIQLGSRPDPMLLKNLGL